MQVGLARGGGGYTLEQWPVWISLMVKITGPAVVVST